MARPPGAPHRRLACSTVVFGPSAPARVGGACGAHWVSFVSLPGAGESGVFQGIAVPESS